MHKEGEGKQKQQEKKRIIKKEKETLNPANSGNQLSAPGERERAAFKHNARKKEDMCIGRVWRKSPAIALPSGGM